MPQQLGQPAAGAQRASPGVLFPAGNLLLPARYAHLSHKVFQQHVRLRQQQLRQIGHRVLLQQIANTPFEAGINVFELSGQVQQIIGHCVEYPHCRLK